MCLIGQTVVYENVLSGHKNKNKKGPPSFLESEDAKHLSLLIKLRSNGVSLSGSYRSVFF